MLRWPFLVSGRRFNNLTSVYLARHTPTGTQVAVRITDLENCSEEHLKALQVKQQLFCPKSGVDSDEYVRSYQTETAFVFVLGRFCQAFPPKE